MKSIARMLSSIVVVGCLLLSTAVSGRKELSENVYVNEGHPELSSPQVLDQQFQFGTADYYWRLDMTPPIIRVGWQTDQSANSKDLTFSLNPDSYRSNDRLPLYSATATPTINLLNGNAAVTDVKKPYFPSSTGYWDRTLAAATLTAGNYDTAYTLLAQKYQYWAVKFKPYIETQFVVTNKIYLNNIMQIDFTFNLESFKAYIWGDASIWYQYDSTNPENPTDSGETTNYKNYFACTDSGVTVKPILMSINLSIKLRNCYKTLIQSLTDWSNWTKIGANTAYFGLLDYCKASDAESVTMFSWNPIASDYNYNFWGNTDNGNPSIDWEGTESGTATNPWAFDYCYHLNGKEYDLNTGGKWGDLYCAATTAPATWQTWAEATTTGAALSPVKLPVEYYDKTLTPALCGP